MPRPSPPTRSARWAKARWRRNASRPAWSAWFPKAGKMIVTPREVDALVERMAGVLADGINQALHPRLSRDEIAQMMAQ
ncbi:MAG: GPR endopeptidase [Christensenellales bacterium]